MNLARQILLLFVVTWSGLAHATQTALDHDLARLLDEERVSGVVYALVDGEATTIGAVGLADRERGSPLDATSKVHVGSVTKTLIALGVLQLATAGRVSLDAPVSTYLPDLALDNPWPASPVRVRHLLDHTSGLDDSRLWHMFSAHADADTPLRDAFTRDPGVLRIRVEPSRRASYSNMGYTLAAMVVEAVTRERYEAYLGRELLAPLGMRDSTFAFVAQGDDPRLAYGHHDDGARAAALRIHLRPAGQFTTTAADMAALARFLMSDGAGLVDGALLAAMGRATTTDAARAGLPVGLGLGLATRDRHGAVMQCHGGSIVGYRAMLCVDRERRKAFFASINTDSETANYGRFDARFVGALGLERTVAAPIALDVDAREWRGRYVPSPSRFESFRYLDFFGDAPRLEVDGQSMSFGSVGLLQPVGRGLLRAPERVIASHALLTDASGGRAISDGGRTWRRVGDAWYRSITASLVAGLLGLAWFVLAIPFRRLRGRGTLAQPALLAMVLFLLAAPLFLLQPFTAMGDRTAASIVLYAASAALPLLMIVQLYVSRRRVSDVVAALAVLQWCVVLYLHDMLPFALWR